MILFLLAMSSFESNQLFKISTRHVFEAVESLTSYVRTALVFSNQLLLFLVLLDDIKAAIKARALQKVRPH